MTIPIDDMAAFCKKKGLVYNTADMYGGLAGFFDYGPFGVEIKNKLKAAWWSYWVQSREDIVGIDGAIITNPSVWKASGHTENFCDQMLVCSKCAAKQRADAFIEEQTGKNLEGASAEELNSLVAENKLVCPACKSSFKEVKDFNLMFSTSIGAAGGDDAYLRPETAQLIFANFKLIQEHARLKPPFGVAQIGKAFRNEISPRNFLFRCREFEQMEIEYFINPTIQTCPYYAELENTHFYLLDAAAQEEGTENILELTAKEAVEKKIMHEWHAYFLAANISWFASLGVRPENFRIREHMKQELAHYSSACFDLEYKFPFGYKELLGVADRGTYDLGRHQEHAKKDLMIYDDDTKEKYLPVVIAEPSLGVDRSFLVFLYEAYDDDKERGNIVLHLHPRLAPITVSVFPLTNKLAGKARELYKALKHSFAVSYDASGSVGRRYARADELGTPFCITVDFEEDGCVTVRDRDTTKQERVKIEALTSYLRKKIEG
ncbi:MAG: glycine--tRNA ligase [Candidatus Woesearchaeota archaeon]|nr:MAG: glycine--tRNA ligase [Candidatus Woesearchaeota archaeon]